ncbi:DUF3800 domain-containing protein [Granulicella cerasi]|uniref:DUF3800 domain-containing protein n=1 Tax=Granulicella cerasi TaxID=741063 RepID=A0ABW1ZB92_9BACT|nr:DUF3800 domain-containing protein [Granulicella cerasi]
MAYLDESFDPAPEGVFAVGAVIGNERDVLKAETEWRSLRKTGDRPFKHRHFRQRPASLEQFARAIANSGMISVGMRLDRGYFSRHRKVAPLPKHYLRDPHLLTYHLHIVLLAYGLSNAGYEGEIDFTCDSCEMHGHNLTESWESLKHKNPRAGSLMGSLFMEDDATCLPLQMADLVAGELRKAGEGWRTDQTATSTAMQILQDQGSLLVLPDMDEKALTSFWSFHAENQSVRKAGS